MRWLLLKDLQILRRSPLLVALLVIYPVVIAVLIGFALSAGPERPRVAFANLVPPGASGRLRSTLALSGGDPPTVEVYYNAEDPVKRRFVEATIEARLAEANDALSDAVLREAAGYIDVIVRGGEIALPLIGSVDILGLQRAQAA